MKKCCKCKEEKVKSEFCKNKRYKDGYHDTCKLCRKEYNSLNKDKIKEYRNENIEYSKQYYMEYLLLNKDKIKEYSKQYYQNPHNRQCKLQYSRDYNKDKNNNEKRRKRIKEWFINNPDYMKNYMVSRYNNDIQFKIKNNLRSRFYHIIKDKIKYKSVLKLLGCSIDDFKQHLESQFLPEMTWDNHGEIWEIDHIKPCASFDLTKLEEQEKCFHYSNLQPLFKTTEIAESFGYVDQIGNRNKSQN